MTLSNIIVSENAYQSDSPHDLIHSNISVVNLLREEGLEDEFIHEDALTSYYIDYYNTQVNQGGFSQFVWNSRWNSDLNELLVEGFEQLGATKNLDYFEKQLRKIKAMSSIKFKKFLDQDYLSKPSQHELLDDSEFFKLEEDLIEFNSDWLRAHPDLKVYSIDGMFAELERILGKEIER